MSSQKQRCSSCFRTSEKDVCPHCGDSTDQDRSPLALPLGKKLKGRYQVGHVLGEPGGFGVTYLAFDERLEIRVAIKEYVPRELVGRGTDGQSVVPYSSGDEEEFEYGLDRFLKEAKALAQFDHANIVSVRDFFEANGTAYLVMDYYEGKTLKQYLAEQAEGRMDPEDAKEVMLRVLDGLREVHSQDYLHRDVKPDNIYLTEEGRPILIDFGAARVALGEKSRSLSVVMTPGYAPYEQYRRDGDQGPWTDVYGCGATLYRIVTGQKPPPATDRVIDDTLEPPYEVNPEVPEGMSRVIEEALATGNKERPSTAKILQTRLKGDSHSSRVAKDSSESRAGPNSRSRRSASFPKWDSRSSDTPRSSSDQQSRGDKQEKPDARSSDRHVSTGAPNASGEQQRSGKHPKDESSELTENDLSGNPRLASLQASRKARYGHQKSISSSSWKNVMYVILFILFVILIMNG